MGTANSGILTKWPEYAALVPGTVDPRRTDEILEETAQGASYVGER